MENLLFLGVPILTHIRVKIKKIYERKKKKKKTKKQRNTRPNIFANRYTRPNIFANRYTESFLLRQKIIYIRRKDKGKFMSKSVRKYSCILSVIILLCNSSVTLLLHQRK